MTIKTSKIRKIWQAIWQSGVIFLLAAVVRLYTKQGRVETFPLVPNCSPDARFALETGNSTILSLDEGRNLCPDKKAVFLDAFSPKDCTRAYFSAHKTLHCGLLTNILIVYGAKFRNILEL